MQPFHWPNDAIMTLHCELSKNTENQVLPSRLHQKMTLITPEQRSSGLVILPQRWQNHKNRLDSGSSSSESPGRPERGRTATIREATLIHGVSATWASEARVCNPDH